MGTAPRWQQMKEDSVHVQVTAPACLQLSLIGSVSLVLLPALLPASMQATCLPESCWLLPIAQDISPSTSLFKSRLNVCSF